MCFALNYHVVPVKFKILWNLLRFYLIIRNRTNKDSLNVWCCTAWIQRIGYNLILFYAFNVLAMTCCPLASVLRIYAEDPQRVDRWRHSGGHVFAVVFCDDKRNIRIFGHA